MGTCKLYNFSCYFVYFHFINSWVTTFTLTLAPHVYIYTYNYTYAKKLSCATWWITVVRRLHKYKELHINLSPNDQFRIVTARTRHPLQNKEVTFSAHSDYVFTDNPTTAGTSGNPWIHQDGVTPRARSLYFSTKFLVFHSRPRPLNTSPYL